VPAHAGLTTLKTMPFPLLFERSCASQPWAGEATPHRVCSSKRGRQSNNHF